MTRFPWTRLASAALLAASFAAACGGKGGPFPGSQPSGGDDGGASSGSSSGVGPGGSSSGLQLGGSSGSSGGSGSGGGNVGCDASCAAAGGTCSGTTCTLTENPGNVSTATQTKLQGGHTADSGTPDSAFKWLYPYDKTVFPKGLVSPTLQFAGGASDAEYVHITSKTLDYKGYFAGGAAGLVKLSLSQKAWVAVTAAVGSGDVAKVEVTKVSGGIVTGPIAESWPIAQGNIRGTVFYETYGSQLISGGVESVGIMKIQPGATQPTPLKTTCGNVCHSASADGSTLVAATSLTESASYDVRGGADGGVPIATINSVTSTIYTYMGLYPDGTYGMSATNFRPAGGNAASRLYDTKVGNAIAAPGWDSVVTKAGMPAFSPDGKQIAFMHADSNAYTISKMDFNASTKTFSGLVDLTTDSSGYVAWPAFTPDGKTILYQFDSNAGATNFDLETDCQNTGDLYAVDVATKTVRRLDVLNGYTGSSTASYLPANDPGLNFAPTMLAEAVGGYFWAIFTSHRSYGNLMGSRANSMGIQFGTCYSTMGDEADGKLWVAAIDINAPPGQDPSHPAFYLDGQELVADNLRGYWVLPACAQLGVGCQSGDQCCSGFCRAEMGSMPVCVTQPKGCSNEFEKCNSASDCCAAGDQCINGRCAGPPAPQ